MNKAEILDALDEISLYFYGCYRNAGGGTRAGKKLHDWMCAVDESKKAIEEQDVPDTNVGKWTTNRAKGHNGEWYCSKCGYEPIVMSDDMKYCPGCGRKMTISEPPKEENT